MISPDLLSECRQLATEICPELADYYLFDAKVLSSVPRYSDCDVLGFCAQPTWRPAEVRSALRAAGIWTGPRTLIALHGDEIAADSGYGEPFRYAVHSIFIHELAHAVPVVESKLTDATIDLFSDKEFIEHLRQRDQAAAIVTKLAAPDSQYDAHDRKFARRVIHLAGRARLRGWPVHYGGLLSRTWFQHAIWYLESLLPEIHQMQNEPIEAIEATPEPDEFRGLWEEDIQFEKQRREGVAHASQIN